MLELLLAGPAEVLLLDEPDNYLDVPAKLWLEDRLAATSKAVLLVSHDRELLARAASRIVTLEPGAAGAVSWVHGGSFATYHAARDDRNSRLEELRRRWDEERAKLKALVLMYKTKAAFNDGLASRYQAAQTRLAKFEAAGPPQAVPLTQKVTMRLAGGRTAKRAVVCTALELTGLMAPFDLEVFYGDRVAVLGSNGSGKSHFLRLLARGGSDPDIEHQPVSDDAIDPVPHTGKAVLGSRVRPGFFRQTHAHGELNGRTLLEILHRGDAHRNGMGREQAARALDRYGLARAGEQTFDTLSGGQQARMQILLLELSGATLMLLDEPTDNLDLHSAEALEIGVGRVRRHRHRRDPRPGVRPDLRFVPDLRRGRWGPAVGRAGLGGRAGAAGAVSRPVDGHRARGVPSATPVRAGTMPPRRRRRPAARPRAGRAHGVGPPVGGPAESGSPG